MTKSHVTNSMGLRGARGARFAAVAALACAATVASGVPVAASAAAAGGTERERGLVATPYALQASAFGTQVRLDSLPVSSARTALVVLGCTRNAGIDHSRGVDADGLEGLGSVEAIATRVWTTSRNGVVSSHARSKVADLVIGGELTGLAAEALIVNTRTWHDSKGFHRAHGFRLSGLTLAGVPVPAGDIEPGETLELPGVLSATFDQRSGQVGPRGATAATTGLQVELLGGDTVTVARAEASINSGVPGGLLGGRAQSLRGSGLVETRNIVKKSVPCRGTGGEWRNDAGAAVDLSPAVQIGAATVGALGDQLGRNEAVTRTRARVGRVSLGGGEVVVKAIRSQANVVRDGNRYTRTANGSSIGSITVGGEPRPVPNPGEALTIPGIAKLTAEVVERTARSITVVGLRIELLGGGNAGETLDVSKSFAQIKAR